MQKASEAWEIGFKAVCLGYGEKIVINNLTATLPKGKISVILGGSGCGKSTLLRHIMGLNKPLSGSITLGGEELEGISKAKLRNLRKHMGVLFQDGALLGALTVGENVVLPLSEHLNLKPKVLRAEALRVLSLVGLKDFVDFYPHELSGGMRKRAGLARAIVANPKILLCDEPTSGLDPITAVQMDDLLLTLQRKLAPMTLVVVSHDLSSLKRIAQFVLVLGNNKCLFKGSLEDLLATQDPYLRRFLERQNEDQGESEWPLMQKEVEEALKKWQDQA
ncbi:MAG: ATP-binding cassette domain-containing protein [Desulfovibrionaceae bacterium]|nr:ATP-binding cassette domain-containing protein [Desulfovibrionaceae bacterium]